VPLWTKSNVPEEPEHLIIVAMFLQDSHLTFFCALLKFCTITLNYVSVLESSLVSGALNIFARTQCTHTHTLQHTQKKSSDIVFCKRAQSFQQ